MKAKLIHEKAIGLLENYAKLLAQRNELEGHILYYGIKYIEIESKERLIRKFEIINHCLKRISDKYEEVIQELIILNDQLIKDSTELKLFNQI
jgi:hypothetical protein